MLVALAGTILPPLLIIGVLSFFYTAFRDNFAVRAVLKGMQAGVVAVILDVVIQLGGRVIRQKNVVSTVVMVLAFAATFVFRVNIIILLLNVRGNRHRAGAGAQPKGAAGRIAEPDPAKRMERNAPKGGLRK